MEILNFLSLGRWNVYLADNQNAAVCIFTFFLVAFLFIKLVRLITIGDSKKLSGFTLLAMIPLRIIVLFITYFVPLMIVSLFNSPAAFFTVISIELAYLLITAIVIAVDDFSEIYYFEFNKWLRNIVVEFTGITENSAKINDKINKINTQLNEYRKNSLIG